MDNLSGGEWLLYCGIGIVILAVFLSAICVLIFSFTSKKLRKKMEQESGKPRN